jgi:hypothetical protein
LTLVGENNLLVRLGIERLHKKRTIAGHWQRVVRSSAFIWAPGKRVVLNCQRKKKAACGFYPEASKVVWLSHETLRIAFNISTRCLQADWATDLLSEVTGQLLPRHVKFVAFPVSEQH